MFYIFDWDGTLSDSTDKIVSCMQAAAIDLGIAELEPDSIKNIIGLGFSEAMDMLYPNLTPALQSKFIEVYGEHFRERDKKPSPFFPNVMETLTKLRDDGGTLAVATGKSRRGLDRVFGNLNLNNFFHYTRCADETASKPDPLMLHELTNEAGFTVKESVMVGDTEWDMVMADNIGMSKIAVSYGAHERERLQSFSPDLLIDDFAIMTEWEFPSAN